MLVTGILLHVGNGDLDIFELRIHAISSIPVRYDW